MQASQEDDSVLLRKTTKSDDSALQEFYRRVQLVGKLEEIYNFLGREALRLKLYGVRSCVLPLLCQMLSVVESVGMDECKRPALVILGPNRQ